MRQVDRHSVAEPLLSFMNWESIPALVGSHTTESLVARVRSEAECCDTLTFCQRNGLTVCLRGSGHSYGDLALNHGQVLLNTTAMNQILGFDETTAQITVQGGTQIVDIYRHVHHLGYALPASPTESIITVAGAIAANVNGKDAWQVGNFGDQVLHLKLMLASGEVRKIDCHQDRDLFLAVVGGLGLLGIVLEVTLQLRQVPSPYLEITRLPMADLDALLRGIEDVEQTSDFAVVWVDTCAKGNHLGRSVIHATRWIPHESTAKQRHHLIATGLKRLHTRRRQALAFFGAVHWVFDVFLEVQRTSVRFFNYGYYLYSRLRRRLGTADNREMFLRYNFDASFTVPPVAVVCGPHGYTIQVTFTKSQARQVITQLLGICQDAPCPPVTTIMRFHRVDDHLISFCEDGYSLNFEFHPKVRHLKDMRGCINRIFDVVAQCGGKVHLAKDMVLTTEQFRSLFPHYRKFLAVKKQLDPEGRFSSDLYRRLMMNTT